MDYIEVTCSFPFSHDKAERIISALAEMGFDGFIEEEDRLIGYIAADAFNPQLLDSFTLPGTSTPDVSFSIRGLKEQNWNKEWEASFQPVVFGNQCMIRAPFHSPIKGVRLDIVIEPKMAFGTAHHETTSLMIEFLLRLELRGKTVLDMGCGTGVLAILSAKMGALAVTAIDNDPWAYRSTIENAGKNNITGLNVYLKDASGIAENAFDLILANINRNILVMDMPRYALGLKKYGTLLVSGFYRDDIPIITQAALKSRLEVNDQHFQGDWAAVRYLKTMAGNEGDPMP